MSETRLINLRHEVVDGAVYIGRRNSFYDLPDSPFANPFKSPKDGTRDEVIAKYREWIKGRLVNSAFLREELELLRGKTLACWCAPKPCHGQVLLELLGE